MVKFITKISFLFFIFILLSLQNSLTQIQTQDVQNQQVTNAPDVSRSPEINLDYGKIPLYFIPNQGQVNKQALFYAKASRYTLWLTREGLVFDSISCRGPESQRHAGTKDSKNHQSLVSSTQRYDRNVSSLIFLNANNNLKVIPVNTTEYKVNYFFGNDESKWNTDIKTSSAVLYKELYKHIDFKVYGMERQIEYDFIVKPGGDTSDIRFEYKHAKETKIDKDGNLVIETEFGKVRHAKPICYQVIRGRKIQVEAQFKEIKKNTYSFKVEKYNKDYELIIDPLVLVYSTYLGGSQGDYSQDIAVDSKGAVYVTGFTLSSDFPIKNALYETFENQKAFIVKINPRGTALIYSTYLGGSGREYGHSIAVDNKGAAYVTGPTNSSDFPTKNPIYTYPGGSNTFIAKINPKGTALIYSTYLGGSREDWPFGIAVDKKGAVYVTGHTDSKKFPTKNPIYGTFSGGWHDAFITKINPKGTALIYSTYLGGSGRDSGYGIAVNNKGAAYVAGNTNSSDFPTKNPIYGTFSGGDIDGFIAKINPKGTALIYSTYLGGSKKDTGSEIAVDNKGAAYIVGTTWSEDFPTKKAFQIKRGSRYDAFVAKVNSKGTALIYSTYLGGTGKDAGSGIAVDNNGAVYVTGYTSSSDFPVKNPLFGTFSGGSCLGDGFITKINPEGTALIYSTFLGGASDDVGQGISVDNKGAVYVTGGTYSLNFPTKNPIYGTYAGEGDLFITKLKY